VGASRDEQVQADIQEHEEHKNAPLKI